MSDEAEREDESVPEAVLSTVVRVAASLLPIVGRKVVSKARQGQIATTAASVLVAAGAERFIDQLKPPQIRRLEQFINSPQFEHLMLQTMLCALAGYKEEDNLAIREQLVASLRHNAVFEEGDLVQAADVLLESLHSAVHAVRSSAPGMFDQGYAVAIASQIATAGARNSELLNRIKTLSEFNRFFNKVRAQARAIYCKLRLPNVVQARAVSYSELYVSPTLREQQSNAGRGINSVLAHQLRFVVLGDPGAGKSTLAAKFVYDLADGKVPGMEGQVPLPLVVRDHTTALRAEHETLVHYLEASCRRAYSIVPPPEAIEYLLLNGLATVIIDGVDELGDSRFRVAFGRMVEAFAHLFPLARILVTSRAVGYDEAPLDDQLFPVVRIQPFSERQVNAYARHWFRLDESLSRERQDALWESFMRDSGEAEDIRSNPLVLSLLCVLYSSERFIPRNRPAVYEKCAELLFDTWDRSRGIDIAYQFRPYVKPAVQQMAWRLFTDNQERQALPRSEMAAFLANSVLAKRFDDQDEAVQAAEDFLHFCAGRAWVLTDTGSDTMEPHYGFVHRTFLEYFAAAQLVKQKPDPETVWSKLLPHIDGGKWAVVSQVAVQILDRDCEDGGDALLRLVIAEADKQAAPDSSMRAWKLLRFAADCLDAIAPHTATIRQLAYAAVRLSSSLSARKRRDSDLRQVSKLRTILNHDAPLLALLWVHAPENSQRVARALADAIEESASRQRLGSSAGLVYYVAKYYSLSRAEGDAGRLLKSELEGRPEPESVSAWGRLITHPTPSDIQQRGLGLLYQMTQMCHISIDSYSKNLLSRTVIDVAPSYSDWNEHVQTLEWMYEVLVDSAWPRGSFGQDIGWGPVVFKLSAAAIDGMDPKARASALLLLAPVLRNLGPFEVRDERMYWFATAPFDGSRRAAAVEIINKWTLPEQAHRRLIAWIQR
ncbi:NACHT domain-containing protein [Micromonospora echinospora]|uniref:NACHT domain-containing protein n=1 Tax=Micromonospora echinospora TaxID=1877 RepID=UPI0037A2C514